MRATAMPELAVAVPRLSERDQEVLEALARGCQSKEIGAQLGLSPKSVDKHIERLREKFDASSRRVLAMRYEAYRRDGVFVAPQPFPLVQDSDLPSPGPGVPADSIFSFGDAATFAPQPPWARPLPPSAPKLWTRLGQGSRLVEMLIGTAALGVAILVIAALMLGASVLR